MAGRGMLTDAIKAKSKELLGYEISQAELRLMPYIQHVLINDRRLSPSHVNDQEREIIRQWREKGYFDGGAGSDVVVTKTFWDAIHEILWLGYGPGRDE